MSRALNLAMTEADIVKHCADKDIGISSLEALPDGGVRLVCMSGYGAEQIRSKLKRHLIAGEVRRERLRPARPLW
jgi:hypothetical protein